MDLVFFIGESIMNYKKLSAEEIQIIADDVAWRKEIIKEFQAFEDKLRKRWLKAIENTNDKV